MDEARGGEAGEDSGKGGVVAAQFVKSPQPLPEQQMKINPLHETFTRNARGEGDIIWGERAGFRRAGFARPLFDRKSSSVLMHSFR